MTTCLIVRNIIVDDEGEGEGVLQGLEFQEMDDPIQHPEQNLVTSEFFFKCISIFVIEELMSSFKII